MLSSVNGPKAYCGFSLVELLLAVGIFGLTAAALGPFMINVFATSRQFERRSEVLDLQLQLGKFVNDRVVCPCHMQNLTIDETTPPSSLDIASLRSDCNPASAPFVEVNKKLPGASDLTVLSIKIADISKTDSDRYSGKLSVEFAPVIGSSNFKPALMPIIFRTRQGAGIPTARPLRDCGQDTGTRLIQCPSSMTLVGPQGGIGSFCIETNPRPAPAVYSEAYTCYSLNTTSPPAVGAYSVCPAHLLHLACQSGLITGMDGTVWEMYEQYSTDNPNDNREFVNGSGCGSYGNAKGFRGYRCCLY